MCKYILATVLPNTNIPSITELTEDVLMVYCKSFFVDSNYVIELFTALKNGKSIIAHNHVIYKLL